MWVCVCVEEERKVVVCVCAVGVCVAWCEHCLKVAGGVCVVEVAGVF